jgi:hypothetical protein
MSGSTAISGRHIGHLEGNPQAGVENLARRLLENADRQRWWSLTREFQLLAEGAPGTFYRCSTRRCTGAITLTQIVSRGMVRRAGRLINSSYPTPRDTSSQGGKVRFLDDDFDRANGFA